MSRPHLPLAACLAILLSSCAITGLPAAEPAYRPSENGRYLIDAKGEPFFWLGDTQWDLFHLLKAGDAAELLRARRDQGFTVIQVMCTGVFPEWIAQNKMPAWTDIRAWTDENPLLPNEAYFHRMDDIVASARDAGMLLVVGVYHAKDVEAGRVTLENVERWCRWLAERYRAAPNIIWSMYPHAEAASVPMIQAAVRGLRAGDGGSHLITLHPDPSPTSSSFLHPESWLSFNTYQSWNSGFLNYKLAAADYARTPVKPVVNGEARYEGEDGTTALEVRQGAWWSILAGAAYSYGHRDNWKSPRSWREWIISPAARQMSLLGDTLRTLSWWTLVPDNGLLVGAAGQTVAARSSQGDWVMVYFPEPGTVSVRLDSIAPAKRLDAFWVNPANGERQVAGEFPVGSAPIFTPPDGWEDALLLISRGK